MINFKVMAWLYFIFPMIILFGFLKNNTKLFLLTAIFFLISLFWATANITHVGYSIYAWLFNIPGFSMFRNYYGQWEFLFLFFYTLILGFSFYSVFVSLKNTFRYLLICGLSLLFIYTAVPFINASLVNKILAQSNDVHIFFAMDPLYEKFLTIVRDLPIDGKI